MRSPIHVPAGTDVTDISGRVVATFVREVPRGCELLPSDLDMADGSPLIAGQQIPRDVLRFLGVVL